MQASTEILTKVDVLPVHGGRRHRPDVVQGRTIAETLEAAATVTGVARRYGLNANQLSAWRRPARDGRLVATAAACSWNTAAREALPDTTPPPLKSNIADDRRQSRASCSLRSGTAFCRADWSDTGSEQAGVRRSIELHELHRAHGARIRRTR